MGRASKWFRSILGLKKPEKDSQQPIPTQQTTARLKKRWSFVKSYREKDNFYHSQTLTKGFATHDHIHVQEIHQEEPNKKVVDDQEPVDSGKHAIAVAAATAAVAEAAVAAAHAAAEVVRLTSSSGRNNSNGVMAYVSGNISTSGFQWREDLAALKIQSAFRGYLARRALRALRSLVRLQALVKGHIQRKKNLARMQAVLKVQKRARAGRIQFSESSHSSSKSSHHFQHPGPPTPEKMEHAIQTRSGKYEQSSMLKRIGSKSNCRTYGDEDKSHLSFNWSEHRMEERLWEHRMARSGPIDEDKSDKILEVDNGRHHFIPKRRNLSYSLHTLSDPYCHSLSNSKDSATHQTVPSFSSGEVQSFTPLKFPCEEEEAIYCTAENSPQFYSASSRGGSGRRSPFTPSKSDGSISLLSGCSDYYPNYMSYTESSKAKVRSISAPKQRPQYERSSSTKRYSIHGFGEPRSSSAQRASAMHASFASKAYPGSGRLDRLGMPIGQRF